MIKLLFTHILKSAFGDSHGFELFGKTEENKYSLILFQL